MPTYDYTDATGSYTLDSPDDLTADQVYRHFIEAGIAQPQKEEAEKPFFRAGDVASALGDVATNLLPATWAGIRRGWEGVQPEHSESYNETMRADAARNQAVLAENERRSQAGELSTVGENIRKIVPSLGFMGASIPSTMAGARTGAFAGGRGAILAGQPELAPHAATAGGIIGGFAGGFGASYRMMGAQFMDDAIEHFNQLSLEKLNRPLNSEERKKIYDDLLPVAQNTALWEAAPEAIGNLATLGAGKVILGIGTPAFKALVRGAKAKVLAGAGAQGTEFLTEGITEFGQGNDQARLEAYQAGTPIEEAKPKYEGFGGLVEATKEVAPAVATLGALMGGLGGVAYGAQKAFSTPTEFTRTDIDSIIDNSLSQAQAELQAAKDSTELSGYAKNSQIAKASEKLQVAKRADQYRQEGQYADVAAMLGGKFTEAPTPPIPTQENQQPQGTVPVVTEEGITMFPPPLPELQVAADALNATANVPFTDVSGKTTAAIIEQNNQIAPQPTIQPEQAAEEVESLSNEELTKRANSYRRFLAANPGYVGVEKDLMALEAELQRRQTTPTANQANFEARNQNMLPDTDDFGGKFEKPLRIDPNSYTNSNGIETVNYINPNNGLVDVYISAFGNNDFIAYMRHYDENGAPTNRWTSKLERRTAKAGATKAMLRELQSRLPKDHQYTEDVSVSTDGLRFFTNQLQQGYEVARNPDGTPQTTEVAISGESITNDLPISVDPNGKFENIRVSNPKEFAKVQEHLAKMLEKFGVGLNKSNVRWENGTVFIDLPVLNKKSQTDKVVEKDQVTTETPSLPETGPPVVDQEAPAVTTVQAAPIQPVETQEVAAREIPLEESVRQEPQDRAESREAEGPSSRGQLLRSAESEVEEEIITSPGEPTPATEGMVTPGGVATERDLLKPYANIAVPDLEKLSTQDWGRRRDYLEGKFRNNQQEKAELLKTPKQNWESREYNENARINEVAASLRAAIQDMQLARPDLEAEFKAKSSTQTESRGDAEVARRSEGETRTTAADVGGANGELRRESETLQRVSEQPAASANLGDKAAGSGTVQPDSSRLTSNVEKFASKIRAQFKADELTEKEEDLKEKYYSINASAGKSASEAKDKAYSAWKRAEAAAKKARADAFAELRRQNKGFTLARIADKEPFILARDLEKHGIVNEAIQAGYTKQGDLYVFQPQTKQAAEKQTPVPLREGTGAAGVIQSEPAEGSISAVEPSISKEPELSTPNSLTQNTPESVDTRVNQLLETGGKTMVDDLTKYLKSLSDKEFNDYVTSDFFEEPKMAIKDGELTSAKTAKRKAAADLLAAPFLSRARTTQAEATFREAERELEQEQERENARSISNLFDKLRTNPVKGKVSQSDVEQAVGDLQNSGQIPNAVFTWRGTSEDLLRQRAAMARSFPGAVAAAEQPNVEGVYENGMAFIFTDRVVVTDLDRRKAEQDGVTPSVAAAKRVLTHENMHKGLALLTPKQQADIMAFLREMFPAAELDELAKYYSQYADWRTNPAHEIALLDERLQKYLEETKTIPTDGVWKQFWDYIKDIWRQWTGKPKGEPTISSMKDVVRLIRSALKNSTKKKPDTTVSGGRVLMSMAQRRGLISPEKVARHAELEAKHNAGTITDAERQEAQELVNEAAKAAGYNVGPVFHGTAEQFNVFDSSIRNSDTAEYGRGLLFFTNNQKLAVEYSKTGRQKYKELQGKIAKAVTKWSNYAWSIVPDRLKYLANWENEHRLTTPLNDLLDDGILTREQYDEYYRLNDGVYNLMDELAKLPNPEGTPTIMRAFLRIPKIVETDASGQGTTFGSWDIVNVELADRMQQENADGFLAKDVYDSPFGTEIRADVYAVRTPSQIKSAEPFTGVPLDQRFDESSPDIRYSYASEFTQESAAGQQTARAVEYTPRQLEAFIGIRKAYEGMPKANGAAIPLSELFDAAKALVPNLTQEDFNAIVQGMYEDNSALLNAGNGKTFGRRKFDFTGKLRADLQKAGQALKGKPASPSVSSENGPPANPRLVESAREASRKEDPSSNLRLLFSTEQRLSNAAPSLEVRQHDAVTVPAALEMIARGGDPQLIAAIWRQHRNDVSQKKTSAPNPFTPSELMRDAYAVQSRKSSTQMVPLQQVFEQMRKAEPWLTQAQFLNRLREDYQSGSVLLEGAGSTQEAQQAGLTLEGTPVGTAVRMAVPPASAGGVFTQDGLPASSVVILPTGAMRSVAGGMSEIDAEYMAAVESGDVAKQQAMVDAVRSKLLESFPRSENENRIPNTSSISSSLTDWKEFGVRDVPIGFLVDAQNEKFPSYMAGGIKRTEELADAIEDAGIESPLILVWESDKYPYVLEGNTRYDALRILASQKRNLPSSIPALVIADQSADPVTYDEQGNVIPLSQRFQPASSDIRYSIASTPEESSAASKFKSASKAAAKGLPDLAEYNGREIKDVDIDPHNKLWFQAYQDAAENLISSLEKQGLSLAQIYDKLNDFEFQRELGIFDPDTGGQTAKSSLSAILLARAYNAKNKARTPSEKAQAEVLYNKVAHFFTGFATESGQKLLMYRLFYQDPKTRFAFMEDKAKAEMLKKADHGVNVGFGGAYGKTQQDVNAGVEGASEQAADKVAADIENAAEDAKDAADLAAGEATLTGRLKALYEELKDVIREEGIIAALLKKVGNTAKFSISAERRNELASMTVEELKKRSERNKKRIEEILETLLGKESEADTAEKKATRAKRKKMADTAKKRAEKGKDVDIKPTEVGKLINKARRDIKGASGKPVQWREIFRQPGKSVEEYRQNILKAVEGSEAFKDLDDAQKRRLADLFAEAWQAERDKVIEDVINQNARSLEMENKKQAAKALRESRNQLLEMVNLGAFTNDEMTRVLGEKFGFKTSFTEAEKAKIAKLAEDLQDDSLNPAKRNKLGLDFLRALQEGTQIPMSELMSNWWVASVLSGGNTAVSIALAFLNGSGIGIIGTHVTRAIKSLVEGNTAAAIDAIVSLFKAYGRHLSSFPSAANRAWQYLWSGNVAYLESAANDPFKNVKSLADIERYKVVADQAAKDPNIVKRIMGKFMQFMGRLLTALDAFNVMITKAGTLSLAMRQSGLTPVQIAEAELKADLATYRKNIIATDPHFGGKTPTSLKDRAYLTSLAEAAMYRDLAKFGVKMENADYMSSESAMTLTPTGVGGLFYNAIKALDNKITANTEKHLKDAQLEWSAEKNARTGINLFVWNALYFAAKQGLNAFGLRFARFAGNKFNQSLSYIPAIGLLRTIESNNPNLKGAQTAFSDTIMRNQLIGGLLIGVGVAILQAIEDEPDDRKRGWFLNGGWNNLTPDQKKQKISQGEKQYTFGIGDMVFNYQNWPINQPLAALGELSDLIRYSPDKWKTKGIGGKAGSAVISGLKASLEIPALTQVGEIFGNSLASKDPTEQTVSRLSRVTAGWAGGFMPRFLKDIDYMANPEMRKYETLFEKAASHVPVYRSYVGKDYYDILGRKIEKKSFPGSREFSSMDERQEYQLLGALNARGIWLTPANAEYRMVGKGRNRRRLTQDEADQYSLETGKLYRQMLLRYAPRALRMPQERAKNYMSGIADDMRDRALQKAVRR